MDVIRVRERVIHDKLYADVNAQMNELSKATREGFTDNINIRV